MWLGGSLKPTSVTGGASSREWGVAGGSLKQTSHIGGASSKKEKKNAKKSTFVEFIYMTLTR